MQSLYDFLSFKTLITPTILVFSYIFCSFITIFISFIVANYIYDKLEFYLSRKNKTILFFIFIVILVIFEIFIRIGFEFIVVYFQIRDALVK